MYSSFVLYVQTWFFFFQSTWFFCIKPFFINIQIYFRNNFRNFNLSEFVPYCLNHQGTISPINEKLHVPISVAYSKNIQINSSKIITKKADGGFYMIFYYLAVIFYFPLIDFVIYFLCLTIPINEWVEVNKKFNNIINIM